MRLPSLHIVFATSFFFQVLHIFMFFLYLIIFNVDVMKTWAGFASLFLGFSFIFGNSIRTTYESVIFLFLAHPYDVGDALLLEG